MDKIKAFLMDYGALIGVPALLMFFAIRDRAQAEKNAKRTAKARRTRVAKAKPKSGAKRRKSGKAKKKGPISKKEFLARMAKGRRKAARARKR